VDKGLVESRLGLDDLRALGYWTHQTRVSCFLCLLDSLVDDSLVDDSANVRSCHPRSPTEEELA
jgi:hypothetical protein